MHFEGATPALWAAAKKYAKALSQSLSMKQRSLALLELILKKEAALQILPLSPAAACGKLAEALGLSERTVSG